MTKTKHTPEPWKWLSGNFGDGWIVDKDEIPVVITPENGQRTVACVNACKGFTTEELERIAANKGDPSAMLKLVEHHLKEKGNP